MKSFFSSLATSATAQAASPATDFLRTDGRMATLLPTAARLIALQKDCRQALPQLFENCDVLKLEESTLTLSAPNAAAAARLKQKLPGLQEKLIQAGWRIESIRLKVQMKIRPTEAIPQRKAMTAQALSSLEHLHEQIARSGNLELTNAIGAILARHKSQK